MAKGDPPRNATEVGKQLRGIFDRVGNVDEDIANLKLDRKDILNEAKGLGFDVKIIQRVMRLRKMERGVRFEERALEEVYLSAIGEGDGALSDAARQFLAGRGPGKGDDLDDDQGDDMPPIGDGKATPKPNVDSNFGDDVGDKPAQITVDDARKLGAAAAAAGKAVTANPFPAGDDRRAAWDEAWCGSLGGDGMEIPPELRASKKADKKGGEPAAPAPPPAPKPEPKPEPTPKRSRKPDELNQDPGGDDDLDQSGGDPDGLDPEFPDDLDQDRGDDDQPPDNNEDE